MDYRGKKIDSLLSRPGICMDTAEKERQKLSLQFAFSSL